MIRKLFRIPSGELLYEEENNYLRFEVDLGEEGTIHGWKDRYRPQPGDWSIATYNSASESPKYFSTDQRNRAKSIDDGPNIFETSVIYSSFVSPGIENGVVSLSVEPFEAGSEVKSRKNWKRNLKLETEVLYVPQMFVMRSKAILAVGHQNSAELVLLEFAN